MLRLNELPRFLRAVLVGSAMCSPAFAGDGEVTPSAVTARTAVVVNVDAENPPFMSRQGGRAVGLYPALLRAALGRCHGSVVIEAKPWKRAFTEIDKAQAGVGGLYKNTERLAKYDFSDPIYVEKIAVYYRHARPFVFSLVSDLYGKRVGVLRGWSYGEMFDTARKNGLLTVEEVSSDRSNFLKLQDGRLDAVLAIEESGAANIAMAGMDGIDRADVFLASYPAHLAFNKAAGMTDLLSCFNRVMLDMKHDGSFERIVDQELGR